MREKTKRTVLSNEEKLRLMLEYMRETGKDITANTEYKGYKLGHFQNNLRQSYFNGTLKMEDNLLKRFKEAGIIQERKQRKEKTTQQQKYNFLMGIAGYNHDEQRKAQMDSGLSTLEVIRQMQIEYNRGNLRLTEEQIENLKRNGFLRHSTPEREELAQRYKIPIKYIVDIIKKYGSYEAFTEQYKTGKTDYDFKREVFCGYRGITLSEEDITEGQKLAYSNLMETLIGKTCEVGAIYLDVDELNTALSEALTDIEKLVIQMRFGLGGQKLSLEECGKRFNVGSERTRQREVKAILKLRIPKRLGTFIGNIKLERANLKKFELEYKNAEKCIDALNKIKEFIKCADQETRRNIGVVSLERLGIRKMTFSPGESEIKTIQDLFDFSESEKEAELDRIRDMPLEYTKLSNRVVTTLKAHGIYTLRGITKISESELNRMRRFGPKTKSEIISTMESLGLKMRDADLQGTKDSDNEENNAEKKILAVLELCDKKTPEYIARSNELRLEIERLRNKIKRYDIAYQNYLNQENIFDSNAIVPAVSKKIPEQDNNSDRNSGEEMKKKALLESIRQNQKQLAELQGILARFGLDESTLGKD